MPDKALGRQAVDVEFGGKRYSASPLTLGDIGDLRMHVKRQRVRVFLEEAARANLRPDFVAKTVGELMITSPSDGAIMDEGSLRYVIYLSLKHKHPDIREQDIDLELADLERLNAIIQAISIPVVSAEATTANPPTGRPTSG